MNESRDASERLRALIVSQSADERAWLLEAFAGDVSSIGHVGECEDADVALALLEDSLYDIVLIDTTADDVAKLASNGQGAAIFFLAKPTNRESPEAVLAAGAADYLASGPAGIDAAELQHALRQGLRFHKINRERSYFAEILRERERQVAQLTVLVHREAKVDARTGWPLHGVVVERLRDELRRAGRYKLPLCVLIIEVEGVADLSKHADADAAAAAMGQVAARVRTVARKTDICGHYGADDFLVLLTNTEREGSLIFCQRVASALEAPLDAPCEGAALRCWFGLAEYLPEVKRNVEQMLATAEGRLRRARERGIHGVVVAD